MCARAFAVVVDVLFWFFACTLLHPDNVEFGAWREKQGDIALQATTVQRMETKPPFFSFPVVSVLLPLLLHNISLSVC